MRSASQRRGITIRAFLTDIDEVSHLRQALNDIDEWLLFGAASTQIGEQLFVWRIKMVYYEIGRASCRERV